MLKKLLNYHEALADKRLRNICDRQDCRVFAKVRLSDTLQIDGSGVSKELYSFALRSHFDFIIASRDAMPLLAVEYDGPLHADCKQDSRDRLKDQLCDYFSLPLLRINARYLEAAYGGLDLLTWIIERWFFDRDVSEAQAHGELPEEEYFDPALVMNIPGYAKRFPLWLSAEPLLKIRAFHESGRCIGWTPSYIIGVDIANNYRALGFLQIDEWSGVVVRTGARSQRMPFLEMDLLHEILPFEILEALQDVFCSKAEPVAISEINALAVAFRATYRVLASGGASRQSKVRP